LQDIHPSIIIIYYYYKSKDYSDNITQKRCRGTLQSSKCDTDAPKYGARTFTLNLRSS